MRNEAIEILIEVEKDYQEFACGVPIEFNKRYIGGLIWNIFKSKKYIHRLSSQDITDIISNLIDRLPNDEQKEQDILETYYKSPEAKALYENKNKPFKM